MAIGIYRTTTEESGAEYAHVRYGTGAALDAVPRTLYEQKGYQPPYDKLPTKEAYEASNA